MQLARYLNTAPLIVAAALFATYWVQLPKASTGAFSALFVASLIAMLISRRPYGHLAARAAALLAFAVAFFALTSYYGYIPASDALKYSAYLIGMYIIGYATGERTRPHTGGAVALFLLVGGSLTFATLCVTSDVSAGSSLEISDRFVRNVFSPGELVNGPGLGLLGSMGMCLIAVPVFGSSRDLGSAAHAAFVGASLASVCIGSYCNLALQNRMPFLAMVAALLAGAVLLMKESGIPRTTKLSRIGLVAASLLVVALVADYVTLTEFGLYQRFTDEGLKTPRYAAWRTMVESLFEAPLGGRRIDIGPVRYVHNLWLDVAWDAGLVPFVLLLAFHAQHARALARFLRLPLPLDYRLLVTGLLCSFLFAFMAEPVLQASAIYFSASCFVLGLASGTERAMRRARV